MEIPIAEKQHGGKTLYTINCGMDCHLLPACAGCNCYRFTYKGGVITNYWQGHGCAQTGQNLYVATTEAECDAKITELELAPIEPTRLICEFNVRSSSSKNFQLPTEDDGTYDAIVKTKKATAKEYTGDPILITEFDDITTLLLFPDADYDDEIYTVKIEKIFHGFSFNNQGSRKKMREWFSFGSLRFGNNGQNLKGCNNLTMDRVSDIPDLTGQTTLEEFWCLNAELTTVKNLKLWNWPNITNIDSAWEWAEKFNQDISECDTSNVITAIATLKQAGLFDQNLGSMPLDSMTDMTDFLDAVTMGTTNYSNTIIGFAAQALSGVTFDGGGSKYASYAATLHWLLTTVYLCDITDGGEEE